ncbi:hypothetical protein KAR91_13745, partial [Candidatus Pacearchaeota archaeon]|nr:hypothetical protein [Candidatus Pacearchaeota archaeon]
DVLNLPDIEDIAQDNHRSKQHSNGIRGSITSFQATVDGTTVPDELNITDLSNDEFGYIGGHRVGTGDIASGYLSGIQATNNSYFPDGGYEYYIYVYYDASTGVFKTTAFKVSDVPSALTSNGEDNYLLIGKVYIDAGRNIIEAYNGDNRYAAAANDNPITDLRKFGTIDSINISDDGFSNIAGDNLISNGEFEEGITNNSPNEWNGTGTFSLDNTNLLGGKHSLSLAQGAIALSNPVPYNQLAIYNLRIAAKASGTSGTYTVGIRGYVGKDWTDVAFSDDASSPINISHLSVVSSVSKTTSWVDSGSGIFTSADWSWTTPLAGGGAGDYDSGDLDLIKYIRVFIRANNDGASTLYIDNVKLTSHNTSYVDVLTDQTVAGVKTFTDPLIVQESVPTIKMVQTTAGTDQGKWLFLANAEYFDMRINDDAEANAAGVFRVERSGTGAGIIVDSVDFQPTNLQHNGTKVPTISSTDTLTNKRLTSPKINSASTTGITSVELETLSDGSNADSLHSHSGGTHTITSHSDVTDATGAQLEILTGGGNTTLHVHDAYEPSFSKNTGFNKTLGTGAGNVSEGDHNHSGTYEPAFSKNTAFNDNYGTSTSTVAEGNHTHSGTFGTWQSGTNNSAVQATTDIFVTAWGSGVGFVAGYSDGNASPSQERCVDDESTSGGSTNCGIAFPVRSGDYWKVNCTTVSYEIWWLAVGS